MPHQTMINRFKNLLSSCIKWQMQPLRQNTSLFVMNTSKDTGNIIRQKALRRHLAFTVHMSSWLLSSFLSGSRTPHGLFRSHFFSVVKKANTVVSEQHRRSTRGTNIHAIWSLISTNTLHFSWTVKRHGREAVEEKNQRMLCITADLLSMFLEVRL